MKTTALTLALGLALGLAGRPARGQVYTYTPNSGGYSYPSYSSGSVAPGYAQPGYAYPGYSYAPRTDSGYQGGYYASPWVSRYSTSGYVREGGRFGFGRRNDHYGYRPARRPLKLPKPWLRR